MKCSATINVHFSLLRSVYSIEGLGGGVRGGRADDPALTCSRSCALACLLAPCTGPATCDMTYNKFKRTLLLCLGLAIFLLGE